MSPSPFRLIYPCLTFSSLKRPGETLESESVKTRKKEDGSVRAGAPVEAHVAANQTPADKVQPNPVDEVDMADFGIRPIDEDTFRLALVPEDLQNAIDMPTAGRPTYQALSGREPPIPLFYEQSQIAGLEGVGPTTTRGRSEGRDIVSIALARAGAEKVRRGAWLMMGEKGDMCSPLMAPDFALYKLPLRPIRGRCNPNGPW